MPVIRSRYARLMPILGLVLFAVTLSTTLLYFRDFFERLGEWGYAGALLIMALNNATIVFPGIGHAFLIASAQTLDPWVLGLVGGIGAGLGEITGYILGRSGRGAISEHRLYKRAQDMMRWTGPTLFVFAATPLPFDVAGVIAGTMRYPLLRFLFWTGLGKIVQTTLIAVGSYYAIGWLYRLFGFGVTE